MGKVGQVVPVLPVALVATIFEEAGQAGLSELELKSKAYQLLQQLEDEGNHILVPRADRDYAVSTGLRMLTMRHIVRLDAGIYRVAADQNELISYYANSIRHLRHN